MIEYTGNVIYKNGFISLVPWQGGDHPVSWDRIYQAKHGLSDEEMNDISM